MKRTRLYISEVNFTLTMEICHYPFTVKANSERHPCEKHLKATWKDIEKNREYGELVNAFCSPETCSGCAVRI